MHEHETTDLFGMVSTAFPAGSDAPFVLSGARTWHVRRGRVDVFAVETSDGVPVGPRTHVLRVERGHSLFGLSATPAAGLSLVGVGGPETELVVADEARLYEWATDPTSAPLLGAEVDAWIRALTGSMIRDTMPPTCLELPAGTPVALAAGTMARPRASVAWITHLEGRSQLAGRAELTFDGEGCLPLWRRAWLTAVDGATVQSCETADVLATADMWLGLDRLHRLTLASITADLSRALPTERERLLRRAATRRRLLADALTGLARTLRPRSASRLSPTTTDQAERANRVHALHTACRVVADALDITVGAVPSPSEFSTRDPLDAIAKTSGFRTRRVMLRDEWWRQDAGPLVAMRGDDMSPVALIPSGRGYMMHDPVSGSVVRVSAAVAATIAPHGWTIYRPFPAISLAARDLIRFGMFGSTKDMLLVVTLGAIAGGLATVPPIVTGILLDSVIPGADRSQLLQATLILGALAIAAALFQLTRNLAMVRIQGKVMSGVQAALWDRLLRLPLTFYRPFTAGDLAVRAMGIDTMRQLLSGALVTAVFGGLFSVFNLGLMFYYSSALALRAAGLLLLAGIATVVVSVLQLQRQRDSVTLRARSAGVVLQLLGNIAKLRVAAAEVHAFARWARLFGEQRALQYGTRMVQIWFDVFTAILPVVASLVLFATALPMLAPDARLLSPGELVAFLGAFTSVLGATLGTGAGVVALLITIPLYENASPILRALPEVGESKMDPGVLRGEIELQQLRFRYAADAPVTLRDVSLHIKAGEFVAFVGPSGSGKSTLLRVLLGFETPEAGALYFDGHDVSGLDIERVRKQVGVVLQNGRLMPGDIFTNIVGSSSATLDDAWEAARMAGLETDIQQMPMGMHTVVSEGGGTLSGGQRQRLMIARAVVARPRLLFFDEATSALDNRTQAVVSSSLAKLQATRVVIAHRLTTIMDADRICVLQAGRIVETGTYHELLGRNGAFTELARRQIA